MYFWNGTLFLQMVDYFPSANMPLKLYWSWAKPVLLDKMYNFITHSLPSKNNPILILDNR